MRCPRCDGVEMYRFAFGDVEIDRCPSCDGVWLDHDELDLILERELGTQIDLVAFSQGAPPVTAPVVTFCHACQAPMIELVGAADVQFEWCQGCGGMFFDKGELSILQAFKDE